MITLAILRRQCLLPVGLIIITHYSLLQALLDFLYHLGILCIGEVHLAGVHLERAAVVGAADILRRQVEVQV